MQVKTIKKVITKKMEDWLSTITDEKLRTSIRKNLLVSGGSITSMFLDEKVNDFDIYIKDMDVLLNLTKYYVTMVNPSIEIFDGRQKEYLMKNIADEDSSQRSVALRTLHKDQIKIFVGGGYQAPKNECVSSEYATAETTPKYVPTFFSPNAISLTDDIQIVCRFHGDVKTIHESFDFIHATNYFTFKEGLVTNLAAIESILTKQLKYQGSKYPLTSIIRTKKFLKRGWNINAGEYLKMAFQLSELNLKSPEVLEEQLIGVDVAYFQTLVDILRGVPSDKLSYDYLCTIIDRVFNEDETEA
jgi:hypothetical protein